MVVGARIKIREGVVDETRPALRYETSRVSGPSEDDGDDGDDDDDDDGDDDDGGEYDDDGDDNTDHHSECKTFRKAISYCNLARLATLVLVGSPGVRSLLACGRALTLPPGFAIPTFVPTLGNRL